MPIELKMPALSPTMEEGTLSKWLVKEGDQVKSGDILAEIETDKATMEFEAVDEGTIAQIVVPEGSDGVKVGAVIAVIAEEGEDASAAKAAPAKAEDATPKNAAGGGGKEPAAAEKGYGASPAHDPKPQNVEPPARAAAPASDAKGDRVKASPLARRLAEQQGVELGSLTGSGPNGRIVKADLDGAKPGVAKAAPAAAQPKTEAQKPSPAAAQPQPGDIPHETVKLSNMRKTIAKRLSESKQTVPHIYLTVDINLDKLLKLRTELNKGLESRGVKLSVNDMLIKAQAAALMEVPACNVQFGGDTLIQFTRADISVAVSIPGGLITPVVTGADTKSLSAIATEIKELAGRAREGKLQPHEYAGGTASLSNMGMYGIKQFEAIINPPQAMILAIGAGEKRALRGRRRADGGDGDVGNRQLRPSCDRRRGWRGLHSGIQAAVREPAGDARLSGGRRSVCARRCARDPGDGDAGGHQSVRRHLRRLADEPDGFGGRVGRLALVGRTRRDDRGGRDGVPPAGLGRRRGVGLCRADRGGADLDEGEGRSLAPRAQRRGHAEGDGGGVHFRRDRRGPAEAVGATDGGLSGVSRDLASCFGERRTEHPFGALSFARLACISGDDCAVRPVQLCSNLFRHGRCGLAVNLRDPGATSADAPVSHFARHSGGIRRFSHYFATSGIGIGSL